jgi:predicted RNase H-like HicB family nuclease
MTFQITVHAAKDGGFWAEVPAIPGCAIQDETFQELLEHLREAIEGCMLASARVGTELNQTFPENPA